MTERRSRPPAPARKRPSELPRALEMELRRTAKPSAVAEAIKWMEQYLRARTVGKTGVARKAVARAKLAAPRAPSIREALGLAAFEAGDLHEAAQELLAFRRLSGARTHDPKIAESYRLRGKPDRALEILEGLDRGSVPERVWIEGVMARARALTDRGQSEVARSIVETALRALGPAGRARLRTAMNEEKQTGSPKASRRSLDPSP